MNSPGVQVEQCDVCIVGAGIAGLNALFVASRYLSRNQKVVLIDRRQRVGGMWVDTYPYVRLHQPYGFFTAGNIKWTLDAKPLYLATKEEVLDHLGHCFDVVKERVQLASYFDWEFESCDESVGKVRITARSMDGRPLVVEAQRLIKTYGVQVTPNEPLQISSTRVISVSPDYCDMRGEEVKAGSTPVWVIGGGKTAMDTAHTLITACPGREVNLIAGPGTFFLNRDRMFPAGIRRWWTGKEATSMFLEMARRFDGNNEANVQKWFRDGFCTWLTPEASNFLFGILSESEAKTIAEGLNAVVMDRFVDVVDRDGVTELVFRSGSTRSIPPGSWIVNCTGYLFHGRHPYEPYVSDGGAVMSVQPRSATLQLSSVQAYFMTHLMFLDRLRDAPLYELDAQEMRLKANVAFPYALAALSQHNLSVISDIVPAKVFSDCGLDFSRWYPFPRRMMGTTQFMLRHRRDRAHHRRTLDTVRERFDVRCGPLGNGKTPAWSDGQLGKPNAAQRRSK